MNAPVAGWPLLLRTGLRAERIITPVTVVVFALMNVSTAASIKTMYAHPEQIAQLRSGLSASAMFVFLLGPIPGDDAVAALTTWRAGLFMIATLGVCAVMAVVRQTRREEEAGRTEMVLAGAVGPLAPLLSAMIAVTVLVTATSAAMAGVIAAYGGGALPVATVFAQYWGVGLAAAGTALIAAEVAASAHAATLAGSAVVVGGYLLRGVADTVPAVSWLRWLTPVGWAERMDPFGADRLWLVLPCLAVFAAGCAVAAGVRRRRDLGAGLFVRRPGPSRGPRHWSLPGIVERLTRVVAVSWAGGTGLYALVVGVLSTQVASLATGNEVVQRVIASAGGGTLTDMFLSTMGVFLAVAAAGGGVGMVIAMRSAERSGRAELLLSAPVSRLRYYVVYAGAALTAALAVLVASATGITVGAGLAGGGWAHTARIAFTGAAVAVPAVALTVAVVLAAYAAHEALALAGWPILLIAFALGPLAEMFGLPHWLREVSPFTHTPAVPVPSGAWLPLTVMSVLAVAVGAIGAAAYSRRDLG